MTLEITRLEQQYADFRLGPMSLTVESGVTAVLGPSGSGKSTLLALVAGFESPDAGRIAVNGSRIDDRPPEDRSVGMVFQNYALFPHLSVRENLAFGARGVEAVESTARLLEIEELLAREPDTLSGGEAQRVALARALVSEPDVLLLDEPLSSLDAPIRRRLRLELRDVLSDLDIPILYVTHDQSEAAIVGDRLALLNDGVLVRDGPTQSVFDSPESAFVAEFLGMENVYPATVLEETAAGAVVDIGDTTLRAAGTVPEEPVAVAIHPETIRLEAAGTRSDGGPTNSIPCAVERVHTQPTEATVVLDYGGPDRLNASVETHVAETLAVGDYCRATIAPENVHLTPRDR